MVNPTLDAFPSAGAGPFFFSLSWARIFKFLRSPRIYSKEPLPHGCVAWRAGTTTPFPTRFLAPIDGLKIPALYSLCYLVVFAPHPPLGHLLVRHLREGVSQRGLAGPAQAHPPDQHDVRAVRHHPLTCSALPPPPSHCSQPGPQVHQPAADSSPEVALVTCC
jgi:hypothetical protein